MESVKIKTKRESDLELSLKNQALIEIKSGTDISILIPHENLSEVILFLINARDEIDEARKYMSVP